MLDSITIFRVVRNGLVAFWRNKWLSAAASLVLTITLVILSVLTMLYGVTDYTVNTVRERVDISVYFKANTTELNAQKVKEDLENMDAVKNVNYISADQALALFKESHKNDPLITQSIEELSDNPLPATLQIKAKQLDQYAQIAETLKTEKYAQYIDKVNFEDNRKVIERLNKTLDFVVAGGLVLAIVFSVIAILVIFNTIALTIYNRREEIEIMRLVGATNWYIRGPFLVEAILYSFLATAVTAIIFVPIFTSVLPQVISYVSPTNSGADFFSLETSLFSIPVSNFWLLLVGQFLVAIILTFTSSLLAMRKHLDI